MSISATCYTLTQYMWVVVTTLDSAKVKPCFFIWGSRTVANRPEWTRTDRNTAKPTNRPSPEVWSSTHLKKLAFAPWQVEKDGSRSGEFGARVP